MPNQFTAEIAEGRELYEELALPDSCTIQRATEARDPGGVTLAWATLASGVACRLSALTNLTNTGGQEAIAAARLVNEALFHLDLPALQDITASDRVVVTVEAQTARTFEVRWVTGRRSWEVSTGALISEMTS